MTPVEQLALRLIEWRQLHKQAAISTTGSDGVAGLGRRVALCPVNYPTKSTINQVGTAIALI
jgi:hypothetical protein